MTTTPADPHPTCRLCRDPAVAVFAFDRGCVCVPEPGDQALCMTHACKATPIGGQAFVRILPGIPDGWDEELVRRFGEPSERGPAPGDPGTGEAGG